MHENHALKAKKTILNQRLILFLKDGEFQRKQVNVNIKPPNWEVNRPHLIKDRLIQETHNLRQLKCLHRSGISFLLGLGKEPVQHHLITAYQRLGNLLMLAEERNTYCMMHTGTNEDHQSLGNSSLLVEDNDDHMSSSMGSLLQFCCKPFIKGKTELNTTQRT